MNVLPRTDRDLMTWIRPRLDVWQDEAAAIGLSEDDLIELSARLDAASEAYAAARAARLHASATTFGWRLAGRALRELASALVASIKAQAERTGNASVYTDAMIPPARRRSTLGPPPAPVLRGLSMPGSGVLEVRWKGTRRGGTMFLVYRALDSVSRNRFTLLDSTTKFVYRDHSIPPGTTSVSYYIIAQRAGGRSGSSSVTTFTFGEGPVARGAMAA